MRDISRVYEGLCMMSPQKFNKVMIFKVWRNEFIRVFEDRLICVEDRLTVEAKIQTELTALIAES